MHSDKCQKCGTILHPTHVMTGRKTPPYSYDVGGCEWFNGEFLCPDCVKVAIEAAAKREDVSISLYFMAMNNREKVF